MRSPKSGQATENYQDETIVTHRIICNFYFPVRMIPPCRNNEPPPPYQDKDREKVNTFDKRFVKPHFLYNSVQKRPLIEQAKERIPLQ